MRYSALTAGFATLAACLLAGCSSRTDVSLTGNTTAQYQHVFITTQEVWFNQSATAGPDDAGWSKFPLSTPVTVDLVQDSGGTLGSLASSLRLLPGTYSQIRLIPVAAVPLTTSAADLGAIYNAEADFEDSAGTPYQLPLELLNPDKGIGVVGSLHISVGSIGSAAAVTSALGATSASTTASTTASTSSSTAGTTAATSSATTTTTTSFTLSLDGARDLVPFTFGTSASPNGILLSSHASAYNLDNVGGISGTLTLTGLTGYTGVSGLPDIQATAETLSADGSRHVAVLSTPVHTDGTFLLYPLPSGTSTAASYDVVIHGAGIATIIVKAVTIPLAASSTDATTASSATTASTPADTAVATTATTSNTVSIGTLIPRGAAAYAASIATTAASPLTADAQVGFYQTLSGSGEVPYQIEASPIDPFNQVLANPPQLSIGTIDSGTYVATGDPIALFSSAPVPAAGTYLVAARAPSFADGPLKPTVSATVPKTTVAALSVDSGALTGSLQVAVIPASPGQFDSGELLVSRNGTLISRASLGAIVGSGGTVTATAPAGTPASKYYLSVRVWNKADLTHVTYQSFPDPVDMSAGNASTTLTIN